MKLLVFIDIDFAKNAAQFVRSFSKKLPGSSFCFLQGTTRNAATDMLVNLPADICFERQIPDLNALEKEWALRGDENLLPYYEKKMGSDIINRCLVAGKYIGDGYIHGGGLPFSPLHKYTKDNRGKRRYLAGLFGFLDEYFKKEKPDLVFLPSLDRSYLMGIYLVAQYYGIQVKVISTIKIESRYCIDSSARLMLPEVESRFRKFVADPSSAEEYILKARDYLKKYRQQPQQPPDDALAMEALFKKMDFKTMFILTVQAIHPTYSPKGIQCAYPSRALLSYVVRNLRMKEYSKSYWKKVDDLCDRPFVYFPLQFEPEATTMIYSPFMTNQFAILEALSKAIPASWTLAVKEHPSMMGRRPRSFYKKLRELPKVEMVYPRGGQFALMEKAELVATITGTAGFEAMLLGKTPLFFGEVFCQAIDEGFVRCTDFERLPESIRMAMNAAPAKDSLLELYLAALFKESFEFPIELLQESWGAQLDGATQEKAWDEVIDRMMLSYSIIQATER